MDFCHHNPRQGGLVPAGAGAGSAHSIRRIFIVNYWSSTMKLLRFL